MESSKVFTGVMWSSIQRFGTMIISFATNIVLARLLTPDDFGTIGMLLLFLAIANTFVDSGLGSAIIQKKDATGIDFSTVFFTNLCLSILVYFVLFIFAPSVSSFYDCDILCPLLRAQGLVLILHAFSIIQTTLLRKWMDFKRLCICYLTANILGSAISIVAALMGYGVWSLVIRTLAVSCLVSLFLWIVNNWKPELVFSVHSFKELFGFGGFMLLSSLLASIANNVQTLIIGKMFLPGILGHYTQARQLRNVASESTSSIITQVLYPDFSNNQHDVKVLSAKLNFSVLTISFIVFALMSFCILVAKPLILLLYGAKWLPCVPYFQLLCVGGCFASLQDVNSNLVAAKGKSKVLFICNVFKIIVFCILMILGANIGGIYGLLGAMIIYSFIAYLVFAILSCHFVGSKLRDQLSSILQCILLAAIPFLIVMLIEHIFLEKFPNIVQVLIVAIVFTSSYLCLAQFTKNRAFLYLLRFIQNKKDK